MIECLELRKLAVLKYIGHFRPERNEPVCPGSAFGRVYPKNTVGDVPWGT